MRVLMVTHTFPRYPGDGTAPFLEAIARGLAGRGHSIDLVLPYHHEFRQEPDEQLQFFPYRYSPIGSWSPWGFGHSLSGEAQIRPSVVALSPLIVAALRRRISRLLNEHPYDVVHANWVVPNGWLAAALCRAGQPLLISLYGSDVSLAERYEWAGRAARRAFERAQAVTACSDDLRGRAEALGAPASRTETIRHGVDSAAFNPDRADPVLRERLSEGRPNDLLLVAAGRLVEVKGFEYLIEAAARLQDIRVAIIGEGELRPRLEEQARTLGAPVTFLGNLRYHSQVADAMATADAVIAPSIVDRAGRVDGLPSTVLEALASGSPVIATRVGGIPEAVRDHENGLLVPEKDPDAIAAAIEYLKDSDLRRRLGLAARRVAVESMTWDETLNGFEKCYRRVTGRHG
jgi:glycosyltransferase involved in cell wall biosynthesis